MLNEMGLRPFTDDELQTAYERLSDRYAALIANGGSTAFDDELYMAIPPAVEPLTLQMWHAVPIGTRAIAASYGGAFWITSVVEKQADETLFETVLRKTEIPVHKRRCTHREFAELITIELAAAIGSTDAVDVIGISLGFMQRNVEVGRHVDASLVYPYHGRNWQTTDFDTSLSRDDQPLIGEMVFERLRLRGISIKTLVFQNDVFSVANDVQHASGLKDGHISNGFVVETGTNASVLGFNLEAGTPLVVQDDQLIADILAMENSPLASEIPLPTNRIGVWMSGGLMSARFFMALRRLSVLPESVSMIGENGDFGELISNLAAAGDVSILQEVAQRVLKQAGQMTGVLLAGVLAAGGYEGGYNAMPIEGSVYWKAFGVAERAMQTVDLLLPGNELTPVHGSGLQGAAQMAMARSISYV